MIKIGLLIIVFFVSLESVQAEGLIGVGGGSGATYNGSNEKELIPISVFEYENKNIIIELMGPEPFFLFKFGSTFSIGPVVSFDFGRSALDKEGITKTDSTKLSFGYDYGLATQFILPDFDMSDEDQLALRFLYQKNSRADDAFTGRIKINYFTKIFKFLRNEMEAELRYSNSEYLNYNFGVTQDTSSDSGLRQYSASTGFQSFSFGQNLILSTSENAGVLLLWNYTRYLQDAAKSPYVKDFGSRNNLFIGTSIFYRWN